jgi:hypothetical protein
MPSRYYIEILNASSEWEPATRPSSIHPDRRTRFVSSFPETLISRAQKMVEDGHVTEDKVRVWDSVDNEVYVHIPPYVFSEEELAERARLKEERARVDAIAAEKQRQENEKAIAIYHAELERGRETLKTKTVDSVEALSTLSPMEQEILFNQIGNAHADSDIDGWGDEGAGYDMRVMAEKLIELGWVYQPKG